MEYLRRQPTSFVEKLYSILNNEKYYDYIRWDKDGKSFVVLNVKNFSKNVISECFNHKNLSGFIRQLNNYSFKKIKNKRYLQYSHPYFTMNDPLLHLMSSKPSKPVYDDEYVEFNRCIIEILDQLKVMLRNLLEHLVHVEDVPMNILSQKVLHLENINDYIEKTAAILSQHQIDAVNVQNVSELMYKLQSSSFSFIFISLNVENPIALINDLRNVDKSIPIIILVSNEIIDQISYKNVYTYERSKFTLKMIEDIINKCI